jgi:chromate transport protein ChrA
LLAAIACACFGFGWLGPLLPLAHQAQTATRVSLTHRLGQLGVPAQAAVAISAAILVAGYSLLLRAAWRGRARLGLAAGLLVATTPWLLPWYAVWVVPLAALEDDRAARVLALALCAYLLPARVPL